MDKYYTPESEKELIEQILYGETIFASGKDGGLFEVKTDGSLRELIQFIEINDVVYDGGNVFRYVNPDLYKIKYLDQEDIESLGFIKEDKFYKKVISPKTSFYNIELCQFLWKTDNYISINKGYSYLDSFQIYRGTIKNKLELKKLLTQLGIDYDNSK